MHSRRKRKRWNRRCIDVDQTPLWVPSQQMAAADCAPLAVTALVLVVLADVVFSLRHLDRLRLPEREGVHGPGGPASTRGAVTVARALWVARDGDLDGTAVALPFEGLLILAHARVFPSCSSTRRPTATLAHRGA